MFSMGVMLALTLTLTDLLLIVLSLCYAVSR